MRATSIETYHATKQFHPTRKEQILQALEMMQSASMHTIGNYLKLELHKISGRFGELEKEGKIKVKFVTNDRKTIWELVK